MDGRADGMPSSVEHRAFRHPLPLFRGPGHVTQADRRDEESSPYAKTSDRPIQMGTYIYIYIHRLDRFK